MGDQTINIIFMRACMLVIYATMLLMFILNFAAIRAGSWQLYMGALFLMSLCNATSISVVGILFRVLISSPPPVQMYCLVDEKRVY